jgi:hypothetical protein
MLTRKCICCYDEKSPAKAGPRFGRNVVDAGIMRAGAIAYAAACHARGCRRLHWRGAALRRYALPAYQAGADGGMKVTRFLFENSKLVRTVERESESWFAAKDVCDARGRAKAALRKLDEDEK